MKPRSADTSQHWDNRGLWTAVCHPLSGQSVLGRCRCRQAPAASQQDLGALCPFPHWVCTARAPEAGLLFTKGKAGPTDLPAARPVKGEANLNLGRLLSPAPAPLCLPRAMAKEPGLGHWPSRQPSPVAPIVSPTSSRTPGLISCKSFKNWARRRLRFPGPGPASSGQRALVGPTLHRLWLGQGQGCFLLAPLTAEGPCPGSHLQPGTKDQGEQGRCPGTEARVGTELGSPLCSQLTRRSSCLGWRFPGPDFMLPLGK